MEHHRQFKTWLLLCLVAFIICLVSEVGAEKKRLYVKTEANPPKQIHHHHYYTVPEPMFGSSRNIAMKSRPEPQGFDGARYNRESSSSRFNHMNMDYYNGHPVLNSDYYPSPSQPDNYHEINYHDDFNPFPKAARLLRMTPPPMQPSPHIRHQQPDTPEDPLPLKSSTRSRRVPSYRVSPDIYSSEFRRPFFSQNTDRHHNVRHVHTSEIVEDDY